VALALTNHLANRVATQGDQRDNWFVDVYIEQARSAVFHAQRACNAQHAGAFEVAQVRLEVLADIGRQFTPSGTRPERAGPVFQAREGLALAQRSLPKMAPTSPEDWARCASDLDGVVSFYFLFLSGVEKQ